MEFSHRLEQAARIFEGPAAPSPPEVIEALLQAEKTAKRAKMLPQYEDLEGAWRLCFVTGTRKAHRQSGSRSGGIALGAGRYLPRWLKIQIAYQPAEIASLEPSWKGGRVENCVAVGGLKLTLSGPTKWRCDRNLLAFDFTQIAVQLFGTTLYRGGIRGSKAKEAEFYAQSIGQQAFFAYFYTSKTAIAARGRGGGLALWSRQKTLA